MDRRPPPSPIPRAIRLSAFLLLRTRRQRPRRRAAEQGYELAPSHVEHPASSRLASPVGLPHAQPAAERPEMPARRIRANRMPASGRGPAEDQQNG